MILRIYTLSGDASHNIENELENAIKYLVAYLGNSFLWQSAIYLGRYFPDVIGQYQRNITIL